MTIIRIAVIAMVTMTLGTATLTGQVGGQFQGGGRGRAGGPPPPPSNLPDAPTAVALPTLSAEITGPGLTAFEKAGWSLPLYREMILSDAAKVSF